jgi:hypothetical protein
MLRASVSPEDRRRMRSPSFSEQDRVQAEAAEHRGTSAGMGAGSEGQRARLAAAKAAQPAVTSLDIEATRFGHLQEPHLKARPPIADNDSEAMAKRFTTEANMPAAVGEQASMFGEPTEGAALPDDKLIELMRNAVAEQLNVPYSQRFSPQASRAYDYRVNKAGGDVGVAYEQIRKELRKAGIQTPKYKAPTDEAAFIDEKNPVGLTGAPITLAGLYDQESAMGEKAASSPASGQIDLWDSALSRIREVKAEASELIRTTSGQNALIGPGFGDSDRLPPQKTGAETADAIKQMQGINEQVRREALEQLAGGVAPGFTPDDIKRREGTSQVAGLTGDKNREVTGKTAYVADLEKPKGVDPEVAATALAGAGSGDGGGRGRGTAKGGFDGWSGGAIHVIVDNTPLLVRSEGAGEGTGAASYAEAADTARARGRQSRADFRYATNRGSEDFVQKEIERFRKDGKSDDQIRGLFKNSQYNGLATALLGEKESGLGSLNAIRRKLNLDPVEGVDVTNQQSNSNDEVLAGYRAKGSAAERNILSRGFQASVTDIFQAPFFETQRAAVNRYNKELGDLNTVMKEQQRASNLSEKAEEAVIAARVKGGKTLVEAEKQAVQYAGALERSNEKVAKQRGLVDERAKDLPGGTTVLRNLGIGALAGGGATALATVVFQLTSQALAAAEEAIGTELEKVADKMTGFANTASKVGNQLSDATRQAGGDAKGVVASAAGSAGLATSVLEEIGPALTRRAEIEAGNKNIQTQTELIRAGRNFEAGESGFLQPGGGVPGLTRSTGGLFGSDVGATSSTVQSLGRQLPGGLQTDSPSLLNLFPIAGQFIGEVAQGVRGREDIKAGILSDPQVAKQFETTIRGWNEQLEKSNTSLKVFTTATDEQGDLLGQALKENQADPFFIQKLQNLGVGLQDEKGNALTAEDIESRGGFAKVGQEFLGGVAEGSGLPGSQELLDGMERTFKAQLGSIQANSDLAQRSLTANIGLQNIQAPPIPLETKLFGSAESGLAVPDAALQTWDSLKNIAIPTMDEINRQTAEGIAQLKEFGVSDQQIAQIEAYGKQITDLATKASDLQLEQQVRDYNRGLELGKRQISDLVGLNGLLATSVKGVGDVQASNLGVQERIVLEKSRELTLLSQELAQRQINFRVAMAGFGAQGLTGEERAARRQQAEYEASIAQKQLNLQKDITGAQFQIVDEQNLRALTDAIYDLEKFQRDYEISVQLKGINEVVALIAKVKDELVAKTSIVMDEFKAVEQLSIQTAASIVKDTGEAFDEVLSKAKKTINEIAKEYASMLNGGEDEPDGPNGSNNWNQPSSMNTGSGSTSRSGTGYTDPNSTGGVNNSTGFVLERDTGGGGFTPTSYSGGSTIGTLVSFGDVTVASQGDLDNIVYEVEKALDRKSALLGLRAPVGS